MAGKNILSEFLFRWVNQLLLNMVVEDVIVVLHDFFFLGLLTGLVLLAEIILLTQFGDQLLPPSDK